MQDIVFRRNIWMIGKLVVTLQPKGCETAHARQLMHASLLSLNRSFGTEYSRKYVFIMATVVLQVPDESLVSKVKNACKMLVGVTSVKVLSKREKSDACIESSEREATRRNVKVQKSTPKVDDITKTVHYKEAMDDVKNGRVYHANSVDDMFNQILG